MSLFRKPKKNLRQRIAESDEEDESHQSPPSIKVEPVTSSNKTSKTKFENGFKKKSSTLSFQEDLEGDDGVETFQIKKSSQSRRIARRMEKERLEKEQKLVGAVNESVNVLKKEPDEVKKPIEKEKQDVILTGREAEMAGYRSDSDEEESDKEAIRFRKPGPFDHVLESGSIPDAAMIHAARKHRQQAREMIGTADYIKIEEMPNSETSQPCTARLVRDDENDKSDEDEAEDGRVDFSVDLRGKDRQQRREAFLAAEREDERNDSEEAEHEMENWERQQFQKAIRQRQVESAQMEAACQQYLSPGSSSSKADEAKSTSSKRPGNAPPDLSKLAPLPSAKELQDKFRERLDSVQQVHRRHVDDLEKMQLDTVSCYEEIEKLELDQPRLSERFHFFQVTRNYVQDLVDCLSTKWNDIESLEKRWLTLLAKRQSMLSERRRNDVRDEAADCATQMDSSRNENSEKVSRTAEREARRRRRRLNRKDVLHKEGLSSDDEIADKEAVHFSSETDKIQRDSGQLFDDVLDEFSSIEAISQRFSEWRIKYPESYREAYVELFLPRLFSCIVRVHLLQAAWNPLQHQVTSLKKSTWFQTLLHFDASCEERSQNKDANVLVISKTIEIAVVPYVTQVVKSAYDPCSTSQTNLLVDLVNTLKDEHPSLAYKMIQQLVNAAVDKFENAIDQDVFIPFHFASKSLTFVNRQFWSAAKLLRNILHWQNLVDDSTLKSTAIDKLFKRYMLIALKSNAIKCDPDTLDKVRYMAAAMPKSWLGPLSSNASSLQPFVEVIMSLAQNADNTTNVGKKQVQQVVVVLRSLGAAAEAQEILLKYA